VILSEPNRKATLKTQERKPVRRKRFQHGSLRKMKLGRQWKCVGKWKDSTDGTTTERLNAHLVPTFGERQLPEITRLLMPE
jgi:hypothetical protein